MKGSAVGDGRAEHPALLLLQLHSKQFTHLLNTKSRVFPVRTKSTAFFKFLKLKNNEKIKIYMNNNKKVIMYNNSNGGL